MNYKILVVDDEKSIMDIIAYNLTKEGYNVVCAEDGELALKTFNTEKPDLVILDVMMPKIDGFDVCKTIRETSSVPIIMLTARADEVDKILGLEIGADDYITKPFSNRELLARVKAHLRRLDVLREAIKDNLTKAPEEGSVTFGDLIIDFDRYEVFKRNEFIALTLREFDLLKFLALNNTQIFTREQLLSQVWGYEYFGDVRAVDVTIRRLREKIEDDPSKPRFIITKRGIGYYFSTN